MLRADRIQQMLTERESELGNCRISLANTLEALAADPTDKGALASARKAKADIADLEAEIGSLKISLNRAQVHDDSDAAKAKRQRRAKHAKDGIDAARALVSEAERIDHWIEAGVKLFAEFNGIRQAALNEVAQHRECLPLPADRKIEINTLALTHLDGVGHINRALACAVSRFIEASGLIPREEVALRIFDFDVKTLAGNTTMTEACSTVAEFVETQVSFHEKRHG